MGPLSLGENEGPLVVHRTTANLVWQLGENNFVWNTISPNYDKTRLSHTLVFCCPPIQEFLPAVLLRKLANMLGWRRGNWKTVSNTGKNDSWKLPIYVCDGSCMDMVMYDNKGSYSSRRIEFFIKDDIENFHQEVDGFTPMLSMNPPKEDKLNKG